MKGLEIAKDFFLNWGMPFLEEEFPQLTERIAAGRFAGSDVLGADDPLSRDHNWGPQFSLFLSENDFDRFGEQLSERMNNNAPSRWKGYWVEGAGDKHVLVENVPHWIQEKIGFVKLPQSDTDWNIIVRHRGVGGTVEARESALYYLKHGALWLNNNEEFALWRKVLEKYPESVWYARLTEECFRLWQYGQYNFIQRVAKRGDPIAISMCLGKFVEGVMRMMLLLHGNYTPYWKWLAHEFRKLDCASHYAPLLESLLGSADTIEQAEIVEKICHAIYQELLSLGVVTGQGVHELSQYLLPLINAQYELMTKVPWMPTSL